MGTCLTSWFQEAHENDLEIVHLSKARENHWCCHCYSNQGEFKGKPASERPWTIQFGETAVDAVAAAVSYMIDHPLGSLVYLVWENRKRVPFMKGRRLKEHNYFSPNKPTVDVDALLKSFADSSENRIE